MNRRVEKTLLTLLFCTFFFGTSASAQNAPRPGDYDFIGPVLPEISEEDASADFLDDCLDALPLVAGIAIVMLSSNETEAERKKREQEELAEYLLDTVRLICGPRVFGGEITTIKKRK